MNTPFPLIRRHIYEEKETKNTWQFTLYNCKGRRLLWYSVPKHLKTNGASTFWQKVADLYIVFRAEDDAKAKVAQLTQDRRKEARATRITALEADLEALFEQVDSEQQALHDYITLQSNSDFLGKIERVVLAV